MASNRDIVFTFNTTECGRRYETYALCKNQRKGNLTLDDGLSEAVGPDVHWEFARKFHGGKEAVVQRHDTGYIVCSPPPWATPGQVQSQHHNL